MNINRYVHEDNQHMAVGFIVSSRQVQGASAGVRGPYLVFYLSGAITTWTAGGSSNG